MHKLFDKILATRISEVFQNHQEVYNPGDWEKLRAMMKQDKKRTIIWIPYFAKAATVALLLGLSVFTVNDIEQKDENNKGDIASISNKIEPQIDTADNQTIFIGKANNQEPVIAFFNRKSRSNGIEKSVVKTNGKENDEIVLLKSDTLENKDNSEIQLVDTKKEIDKQKEQIKKIDNSKPDSLKINSLDDNSDFLIVDDQKKDKRFNFGVEVASVSNYASEGEGSSLNVGGGISTSWHIAKNFSLSSGMLIARQSMSYSKNESSDMLMNGVAADYASSNSLNMIDVNTAESKLEFVGIDIPINIQFSHKRMTITTGVSSLLYVQEKYSYSYNSIVTNTKYNSTAGKFETQNSVKQVKTQEKSEIFNRFDFARLLNFAVGYKIPLSKGDLVFEPYVKLPIGDISSYQIKMGSGGFALRYNF